MNVLSPTRFSNRIVSCCFVLLAVALCALSASGQDALVRTLKGSMYREYDVIAFSPDGSILASASPFRRGEIVLWDVATWEEVRILTGTNVGIGSLSFSPDGQTIAAGGVVLDIVVLWDVATGRYTTFRTGNVASWINHVAFSPDGSVLATSGSSDIKLWDVDTWEEIRTISNAGGALAFSPDGTVLASGSGMLWGVVSGRELHSHSGQRSGFRSLAFSPDGTLLAAGLQYIGRTHPTIALWDTRTGEEIATLTGHTDSVNSVAFSSDGRILATSGSEDAMIKLWDVETWEEVATLTGHMRSVGSVAFNLDGTTLASAGSRDGTIKLWDVSTAFNRPPTAHFTFAPTPARIHTPIEFNAAASYDPDGQVVLYEWDWNSDGIYETSTTMAVSWYQFANAGTHKVTLRVTDDAGATAAITETVVVLEEDTPPGSQD